jgi:hypothetical protein
MIMENPARTGDHEDQAAHLAGYRKYLLPEMPA